MSARAHMHPLVAAYLERLGIAAQALRGSARDELIADIEGHLHEAVHAGMSDADVRSVLDRLGEPEEIVAEQALPDFAEAGQGPGALHGAQAGGAPASAVAGRAARATGRRGLLELAAIFLLLFGGFLFVVGWFAGLFLLWWSGAWRLREKVMGTLLVPGGLAGSVYFLAFALGSVTDCSGGSGLPTVCHTHGGLPQPLGPIILILALVVPLIVATHLWRQAGRHTVVAD